MKLSFILILSLLVSLPSFALEEKLSKRLSGHMWVEIDERCKKDGYDYDIEDALFQYSFDKTQIKFLKTINFDEISEFNIALNRCNKREYREERKTNPHDLCFHLKQKGDNRDESYIFCPPYKDFKILYKSILASLEKYYFKDAKALLVYKHQEFLKFIELHPFIDTVSHMADYFQFRPFMDSLGNIEKNRLLKNYQATLANRYPGIITPGVYYKRLSRTGNDGFAEVSNCEVWSLYPKSRMDNRQTAADECSIKTVRITTSSFEVTKSMIKEARILKYLGKHSNIIGLKDYNISISKSGAIKSVYLVTERGGEDLEEFVKKSRYLSPTDYYWITLKLLTGLSYMHYKQIYHLDIKPENILVRGDHGESIEVKITDFGESRESIFLDNEIDKKAHSRAGTDEWNVKEELKKEIDFEKNDAYSAALSLLNTMFAHRYYIPFSARNSGSRYLPDFWISYAANEDIQDRLFDDYLDNLLGLLILMIKPQDERITVGRAAHVLNKNWAGWLPSDKKRLNLKKYFRKKE